MRIRRNDIPFATVLITSGKISAATHADRYLCVLVTWIDLRRPIQRGKQKIRGMGTRERKRENTGRLQERWTRVISVLITGRILVFPRCRTLIESYSVDVISGGLCNACLILIRAIMAIMD